MSTLLLTASRGIRLLSHLRYLQYLRHLRHLQYLRYIRLLLAGHAGRLPDSHHRKMAARAQSIARPPKHLATLVRLLGVLKRVQASPWITVLLGNPQLGKALIEWSSAAGARLLRSRGT